MCTVGIMAAVWVGIATAGAEVVPEPVPGFERAMDLAPGEGNPRNSEGDFIALKDGRLLFIYTHYTGGADDDAAAYLAGRFSSDVGQTWTPEDVTVLANEGGQNVMSVSLLRLPDESIGLFYLRKNSVADCRPYLRLSRDEAKTWGEPTLCIPDEGYYVVNNDRVVSLKSGRLVVPASDHTFYTEEFAPRGVAVCYLSDDGGKSWRRGKGAVESPETSRSGLQEPGVVELKDGRLLMFCRTDQGCQMLSWSSDEGETWSGPQTSNIASPLSPATIERVPSSGHLLMVWNDHSSIDEALRGKRTPLSIAVSTDEGSTWTKTRIIEDDPRGWYCYTAMEFVPGGVLLAYCAGDTRSENGLARTRITRVGLDWVYSK